MEGGFVLWSQYAGSNRWLSCKGAQERNFPQISLISRSNVRFIGRAYFNLFFSPENGLHNYSSIIFGGTKP